MKLSLQNLLIYLFLGFILIASVYKYLEWNSLKSLSKLYNQAWTQEFSSVEKESDLSRQWATLTKKVWDKNSDYNTFLDSYNDLNGTLKLIISNHNDYMNLINENNNKYKNFIGFFLLGSRGDLINKITSSQQKYYGYEINDSEINNTGWWLDLNLYTAFRDRDLISEFNDKTSYGDLKTTAPKYFYLLAPLDRYSDNSFKWDHEDEIKKYYPNGLDTLSKYKNYFSDYYSMVKDYVAGDYQSSAYKYAALKESSVELNPDLSDLFKESNDKLISNATNIIKIISEESNSIKEFNKNKLYKYPILPDINKWKEDLVLCQMYDFKAGLYWLTSNKYVSSQNLNDLLVELSNLPPDTKFVDKSFDKSVMKFSNSDQEIEFSCLDKGSQHDYSFGYLK